MRASVIVRTKDEADRLRLTLTSLAVQTEQAEVVVVNDGSTDHTGAVLAAFSSRLDLVRIDHATPKGRSVASNVGGKQASGDVLIFLDGDTLASPDFVARHLDVARSSPDHMGRGETFHLRCTRFFADPDSGSPMPGEEARVARLSAAECRRMRVSAADIVQDFASIEARAQPGIYPGAGPGILYDREMEALRNHPDCDVLWAAASGSNQAVDRKAFLASGGFDPDLQINAHRECALRLCEAGLRMVPIDGARTYHLNHRSGWRDPLAERDWEAQFYRRHPIPAVVLQSIFWESLSDPLPFPKEGRILSLPDLEKAAARCAGIVGIENVRAAHFAAAGVAVPAMEML